MPTKDDLALAIMSKLLDNTKSALREGCVDEAKMFLALLDIKFAFYKADKKRDTVTTANSPPNQRRST